MFQRLSIWLYSADIAYQSSARIGGLLCLQYYYIATDKWDISGISSNDLELYKNRLIVKPRPTGDGCCAFLYEIVSFGTFTWKFKIHRSICGAQTYGVWRVNHETTPQSACSTNCFVSHHPYTFGAGPFPLGGNDTNGGFEVNDIVTMDLNLETLTLTLQLKWIQNR